MGGVPALVAALCDDAAIFPPGLAPLPDAVRAYQDRRGQWYAGLVGPLVVAAGALPHLDALPTAGLPLSVTLPGGPAHLPAVLASAARSDADLRSVEVAVPDDLTAQEFLDSLATDLHGAAPVDVYVELPRDDRRAALLEASPGRYRAKFRTGGVRAELHPDEAELAAALAAAVEAEVPFKATAGLHHALRNTDPTTGFEQHGFLNLLLATSALVRGGTELDARTLLAERDGVAVAALLHELDDTAVHRTRAAFTSFGTCSITDPRDELVELGVLSSPTAEGSTP